MSLWFLGTALAQVPTPEQVFGFRPGADYKLADYPMIVDYFRKLAAAAPDRIKVVEIGKTAEGQTQIMAIISSPENMKRLDRWREISRKLALARGLTEEQARALAREGRAIVWIDAGLHASEVAHGQHAPEMAWRVVTEESDEMRFIRDNVVLLHVPVMNPDGLNLIAAWYKKNVGTPYELADMPWLYHKYVGHDNNRDWYLFTQPESRNVARLLYQEWFPQIIYNHHQSGSLSPRIVIPPYDDPMNPNIPPGVIRGVHLVGDAIAARFAREQKPGVVSRVSYDTWWNGGMRTAPYFHNMVGILTETALFRYATPRFYKPEELPRTLPNGLPYTEPSTFNPQPWKGGWWRLRDAVEYELTASMAVLDIGARLREDWLQNIYRMGREAVAAGEKGGPFAYVIPPDQWDPSAARDLLQALSIGGVEIRRAAAEFTADGQKLPAGSHVILAAQPYRAYVLDLMEPQKYPDLRTAGGAPKRPYDITGWTLPLQMGVEVKRVEKPFEARLDAAQAFLPVPSNPNGFEGKAYVLDPRDTNLARAVNRLLRAGAQVTVAPAKFAGTGGEHPAGSVVVTGGARAAETLAGIARDLALSPVPLDALPSGMLKLRPPRIGLYQSWVANMDEGWTRWVLEQWEFTYTTLHDADVRAGNLRAKFDAVILPAQEFRPLLHGHQPGEPAERGRGGESDTTRRVQRPEYTGGIGIEGVLELKRFVEAGGTLVALDAASNLPIQLFGIPVRNVLANVRSEDFYAPGSLLRLEVDTNHPLTYGMKKDAIAFFVSSPAFQVFDGANAKVLARYPRKDVLASGWLLGERQIAGRAALVEAPLGQGRVVLIGFRSQFRAQPRNTFKVLFNSLYASATE